MAERRGERLREQKTSGRGNGRVNARIWNDYGKEEPEISVQVLQEIRKRSTNISKRLEQL